MVTLPVLEKTYKGVHPDTQKNQVSLNFSDGNNWSIQSNNWSLTVQFQVDKTLVLSNKLCYYRCLKGNLSPKIYF